MDRRVFERWRARLESGLLQLMAQPLPEARKTGLREALDRTRGLLRLNSPLARLYNSLGELSLRVGCQILSIVLLERAASLAPDNPAPRINLGRTRLSLANRFLLKVPGSSAVAFNLNRGGSQLDSLLAGGRLPEAGLVEATLLRRRIQDRLEMWKDLKSGSLPAVEVRRLLQEENRELRPLLSGKLPSLAELEKLSPARTGFYYREYREQQKQGNNGRRGGKR